MSAKIIVITNQKGGCGKTTLTMNLAPGISRVTGKRVLVVDGDPQGTATRWAASADEKSPFPAHVMGLSHAEGKAHQEIKKFIDNYDYILVDCPPSVDNNFTDSSLLVADLALVPVKPTPADLWAAVGIKKVIKSAGSFNEALQARLVASMCQLNSIMSKDVIETMGEFGIEKFETNVSQRTAYTQATLSGGSVFNLKDEKAISEITKLTKEVLNILHGNSYK